MEFGCCIDAAYLPHVLTSGFDFAELKCGVTLPDEPEAVWRIERQKLLAHQVPIQSFNVLLPGAMPVVGPEVRLDALRAYLDIVFCRMAELGGKNVSFGSGGARKVPEGFARGQAEDQVVAFIQVLSEMADTYSIQVNVEFLNQKETNLITSATEAYRYTQRVNHDKIRILADLYHLMEEAEPLSDLYQTREHIGYVHVADTKRLYPGSGTYPYQEFFQILNDIGYVGPVSVECGWQDTVQEMKKSAGFLKQISSQFS
ncbi:sugar phosphate isomerase/epimerase family protein [Alicyclobacillus fodiniaquatilis]|uniref:Sugar phosphate isomerase/epimerase family protein n=1 Tax=Alicyclobacillus fodiniaquatilis TaxID=1661150 RepID=A0ABW4JFK5_9BACL